MRLLSILILLAATATIEAQPVPEQLGKPQKQMPLVKDDDQPNVALIQVRATMLQRIHQRKADRHQRLADMQAVRRGVFVPVDMNASKANVNDPKAKK